MLQKRDRQKTHKYMLITIINNESWQSNDNPKSRKKTINKQMKDIQETFKRQNELQDSSNNDTSTTLKNVKNVKNDKNKPTTDQKQKIHFDFDKETWENITIKDKDSWKEAYPACDIDLEIKQMKEWLLSNPSKRKANYRRFITNWLARSQEKGGSKKGDKKPDERKVFNQALESLNIYYSKNKLAAWLDRLPEKYHKEFQKYPDFKEVEEGWKKKELQSNY